MLTRSLVVCGEKRLDVARFGVDEERLDRTRRLEVSSRLARKRRKGARELLRRGRRGESTVERLLHTPVLHADGAADDGQLPEVLVGRLDAEVRAVGRARELANQFEECPLVRRAHVVFQKIGDEQVDGAFAEMGQARVGRLPVRVDARGALARVGDDDALGRRKRRCVGAHDCVGDARDRVRRRAALDVDNRAVFEALARECGVVEALLAVAHRELSVGREEKRRVGEALAIIRDVVHARFLVRAEDDADRVGKLFALVEPKLHRVERRYDGTLVVDDATAHEVALAARDGERLDRPAGAGGNHVDVPDDTDLRVGFTRQVGISHIAVDVVNLKAHAARNVERLGEGSSGAGAERCAGFCRRQVFRALDAHDALDVRNDAFPILLEIRIDLARKNVFHEAASLILLLSHQLYPSAQPANSPQLCDSRKEDESWTSAGAPAGLGGGEARGRAREKREGTKAETHGGGPPGERETRGTDSAGAGRAGCGQTAGRAGRAKQNAEQFCHGRVCALPLYCEG